MGISVCESFIESSPSDLLTGVCYLSTSRSLLLHKDLSLVVVKSLESQTGGVGSVEGLLLGKELWLSSWKVITKGDGLPLMVDAILNSNSVTSGVHLVESDVRHLFRALDVLGFFSLESDVELLLVNGLLS